MLPTLCQPSQQLTGGWSGKSHSRLLLKLVSFEDEPSFVFFFFFFEGCSERSKWLVYCPFNASVRFGAWKRVHSANCYSINACGLLLCLCQHSLLL